MTIHRTGCNNNDQSDNSAELSFCPSKYESSFPQLLADDSAPRAFYLDRSTQDGAPLQIAMFACDPANPGPVSHLSWSMVADTPLFNYPPPSTWSGGILYPSSGTYPGDGIPTYYPPTEGFGSSTDAFLYQVANGSTPGNIAMVSINITPVTPDWYVDGNAVGQTVDGLSWQTAFRHPQDAVDAASPDEMIWVAAFNYNSPSPGSPTVPVLDMKVPGIRIFGGFDGKETTLSQRSPSSYISTLHGQNSVYNVVRGVSNGLLDGFTITGGYHDTGEMGAGMINSGVTGLVVRNCIFNGNYSYAGQGGAMANTGSSVRVERSRFFYNEGSAIYNSGSTLRLDNCLFSGNSNSSGDGGALYVDGSSSIDVRYCTFSGNNAEFYGGAIALATIGSPQVEVRNSILWGDDALTGDDSVDEISGQGTVLYSDVDMGTFPTYAGAGNIEAVPNFWNPQLNDYRLLSSSPCIDIGTDAGVGMDINFMPRPSTVGGVVDMGAYEY
jgi:predicted outer membrane repeat protein